MAEVLITAAAAAGVFAAAALGGALILRALDRDQPEQ